MNVDVLWLSTRAETPARGYWDQAIVEELLAGRLWRPGGFPAFVHHEDPAALPDGRGAVVVLPARHHAGCVDQVNEVISRLPWVLLLLTGDEEGSFPVERLSHPRMRVWVQTPQPGRTYPAWATRFLPNGATPAAYAARPAVKTRPWVFAGQVTHERRRQCVEVLRALNAEADDDDALHDIPGEIVESDRFAGGIDQGAYLDLLASAKVAPCPSGPVTVDTFRLWEALHLGCFPVADNRTPRADQGAYWAMVGAPWVTAVDDWAEFPDLADRVVDVWPEPGSRAQASLIGYHRGLVYALMDDLRDLSGCDLASTDPAGQVTVLMPTSPIPAHPDTSVIEQTIASVRAQLPGVEIIVMCDGVRAEFVGRRAAYEEYLHRLVGLCREWGNVLPVIHGDHLHQAAMTRRALSTVRTPQILFVEHDCPIGQNIPWAGLTGVVAAGDADVIRLHHEARILPEHEHLMLGEARDVRGVRLAPTVQWSQRPHLAPTDYYRRVIGEHFAEGEKTMIEDRMHSVAQSWPDRHRLWILHEEAPVHGIKASWHLDGRGGDPKWVDR